MCASLKHGAWSTCSNPLAGTDSTLLALAGTGYSDMRAFGFACCERAVGAAEGINVLLERKLVGPEGPEYIYNVTNLEYTEFEKYRFADECEEGSEFSRFPANTNVLYISLKVSCRLAFSGWFTCCHWICC